MTLSFPPRVPLGPRAVIKKGCLSNTGPGITNPNGEKLQLAFVVHFLQGSNMVQWEDL